MLSSFSSVRRRKPLKIVCDAPSYEVVKASEQVGMRAPEDVRWQRQTMPEGESIKRKSLARRIWRLLFAFGVSNAVETCSCGNSLPERSFVLLRKRSGKSIRYALTQCDHCRTIVWDQEQTSQEPSAVNQVGNA